MKEEKIAAVEGVAAGLCETLVSVRPEEVDS